jgi:anti-sigma regulatory factor (Ser/Thr protein kinase)
MNVLRLSIPPLPRYAGTARSAFSTFAGAHRLARKDFENLMFALGEAIANAIQHAETGEAIDVSFRIEGDSIVASVRDRGRGFSAPHGPVALPHLYAEAGRGFAIMQRCTDFLDVDSQPGTGTVVTFGRYRRDRQELDTAS